MTELDKAIAAAGGVSKLAALVGLLPMAITQWKKRGVPAERCIQVEAAVGGATNRYKLRPDVFGADPSDQHQAAA